MTETMEEVLTQHQLSVVWQDQDGAGITCMCGADVPTEITRNEIDTQWLAAHQADALNAAGFGPLREAQEHAWNEGAATAGLGWDENRETEFEVRNPYHADARTKRTGQLMKNAVIRRKNLMAYRGRALLTKRPAPKKVFTAAELDEMPQGSIVIDEMSTLARQIGKGLWFAAGDEYTSEELTQGWLKLPANVLRFGSTG